MGTRDGVSSDKFRIESGVEFKNEGGVEFRNESGVEFRNESGVEFQLGSRVEFRMAEVQDGVSPDSLACSNSCCLLACPSSVIRG